MAYVLSSVSGNLISAASAGWAPTNSADVSAIASAYAESAASSKQDTLTFSYDSDKISAINGSALAGQGGGGLVTAIGTSESGITSLNNSGLVDTAALHSADYSSLYVQEPLYISASGDSSYIGISGNVGGIDSATCSAIASSYAESAASGKLDATAQVVTSTASASAVMMDGTSYYASKINGLNISAQKAYVADEWMHAGDKLDATAQVVTSTATQLNAGSAYLTSVNSTPISASRAGNAANATLATSAWYDGTGRLISSLPDEATVSSIASAYAESAASGKQDTLTFDWDADSAISSINGSALAGGGGAQVVTSITTGGYGVREINGMVINASHMVLGAAAANNTSNVVRLGDETYGAGVFLSGSFGTAYYKVNELQLNRNGTGFIGFNIGGAGSQITATSNAGGKFSAGGTGGNRSYFTAFNASASASIEVTGDTAMVNITDTGYTSTIYPSSIPYWNGKADSSALSSYVPYSSLEYNTASAISGIDGSALAAGSTYTAGEGIDITDDVISVEAPVDIVAGPGIVIDNPDGNTLRVSQATPSDETVLYESDTAVAQNSTFQLSETPANFKTIKIYIAHAQTVTNWSMVLEYPSEATRYDIVMAAADNATSLIFDRFYFSRSGTTVTVGARKRHTLSGTSVTSSDLNNPALIMKVIGIHRIANN